MVIIGVNASRGDFSKIPTFWDHDSLTFIFTLPKVTEYFFFLM